jgi:hypothetical protein
MQSTQDIRPAKVSELIFSKILCFDVVNQSDDKVNPVFVCSAVQISKENCIKEGPRSSPVRPSG